VCGVWCVVSGLWFVVCGVWCVVCGVWCVMCGVWFVLISRGHNNVELYSMSTRQKSTGMSHVTILSEQKRTIKSHINLGIAGFSLVISLREVHLCLLKTCVGSRSYNFYLNSV